MNECCFSGALSADDIDVAQLGKRKTHVRLCISAGIGYLFPPILVVIQGWRDSGIQPNCGSGLVPVGKTNTTCLRSRRKRRAVGGNLEFSFLYPFSKFPRK